MAEQRKGTRTRKKTERRVTSGVAHVESTFNNTKVLITDRAGNAVSWCSGGKLGHKGSRKSTSYVAQLVGQDAARRAMDFGMREIEVRIKGPGAGPAVTANGILCDILKVIK